MNNPFNSQIEIATRILLTLSVQPERTMTIDAITASDFITVYAKEFGLSNLNLHGDNNFSFTEFTLRRKQFESTMPFLVRQDLISFKKIDDGFGYTINPHGQEFISGFNSDYTKQYRNLAKITKLYTSELEQKDFLSLIMSKAKTSIDWRNND